MRLPAAAAAILLSPLALAAQAVPGPSFEDVLGLRTASSPAISPDGRSVAFTVRTPDWKENRFDDEVWLAREGEEPVQATFTEKGSSTSPRWSPDGRWIAFLADRGDRQQVHLLPAAGGEARKLTAVKEGVAAFRWAPDGKRIAFTAQDPEDEAARRRKERYGDFAVEDAEYRQSHLWVVDVPASPASGALPEPRRLTEGKGFTVTGFAWAPDGRSIAVEHRADPLITSLASADISVVEVETRRLRPLAAGPGSDTNPVWSPDSRWVLYTTAAGDTATFFYRNGEVAIVSAEGGAPRRVAAEFDEQVSGVAWTPTGIYFLAWEGTKRRVFTLDPRTGRTRPLSGTPEVVSALDFSADGRTVALLGQTATTLPEVYRSPVARLRPVAMTSFSRQISGWPVGSSEVVSWRSSDGTMVEGVLHRPADFDPSRRYPLLVVIHGGPTAIDFPTPLPGYVYPIPQWLAKGALVLRPNYRGSAGYGEKFRSLNVRNLGVGDAWDVLSGVDHLVRQGIVDTTRMGAMGWSQGGYISAFLTTTSQRFRAISVGAGISNWMTYYVNTDIHPFTRQYLQATPWEDPEIYARTSPMTYVRQARTPTLIQHGELDRRVPIANAYELFQGLQDQGVPAKLIVYRGFGHGIDKPRERLAALWHNWQWFGKHLWGEEVELPLGEPAAGK